MMLLQLAHADGNPSIRSIQSVELACNLLAVDLADLHHSFNRESIGGRESNADFEVLGCSPSDTTATIKRKYRELTKKFHPDKLAAKDLPPEIASLAVEKFRQIQEAYERIISNRS
jgi:DnaJ like chaperone protein